MKNLDTTKILKRLIIVSWVALGCCFLIKLLGGNLFEIVCNNQRFITICNYIDNNWFLYYFVMTSYCYLSMYFLVLAMCQRTMYKKWELITLTITILIVNVVKMFSNPIGIILDIWQGIVMPILFVRKTPKKILNVLLANTNNLILHIDDNQINLALNTMKFLQKESEKFFKEYTASIPSLLLTIKISPHGEIIAL